MTCLADDELFLRKYDEAVRRAHAAEAQLAAARRTTTDPTELMTEKQVRDLVVVLHDEIDGLRAQLAGRRRSQVTTRTITIRLPLADWYQIVSEIENMCGASASEIEILQSVEELPDFPVGAAGGDQ